MAIRFEATEDYRRRFVPTSVHCTIHAIVQSTLLIGFAAAAPAQSTVQWRTARGIYGGWEALAAEAPGCLLQVARRSNGVGWSELRGGTNSNAVSRNDDASEEVFRFSATEAGSPSALTSRS